MKPELNKNIIILQFEKEILEIVDKYAETSSIDKIKDLVVNIDKLNKDTIIKSLEAILNLVKGIKNE